MNPAIEGSGELSKQVDRGDNCAMICYILVAPFSPFYFGVSLLKLNIRKKGTLFMGVLRNLVDTAYGGSASK